MSEYKGFYPDGPNGTGVLLDVRRGMQPDAIDLQEAASVIFDEPIVTPLDPKIYRPGELV